MKVYLARQPIFSSNQTLFGYELLYRNSDKNEYDKDMDGSRATRAIISDAVVTFGLRNLTHGKYAFINFTKALLMTDFPFLLNPEDFIIEILESTITDKELLEQLDLLKKKDYILALDDYIGGKEHEKLVERSDILKVDFRLTDRHTQLAIARRYAGEKQLLAEKIETKEEFLWAKKQGYTLFQGYYFARPTMFSKNFLDIASTTYMRILYEISRSCPDFDNLAEIIRLDVNLMYKLLHRINTLEYYRSHRVKSIKHALVRMGLHEIRRWATLILLRDVMHCDNDEMIRTALVRGVFAEYLAQEIGLEEEEEEAYTAGLFSTIDAILEEDLFTVLKELYISEQVKLALLGEQGLLKDILDFVKFYEVGNWDALEPFLQNYAMDTDKISNLYMESIRYADLAFDDTQDQLSLDGRI